MRGTRLITFVLAAIISGTAYSQAPDAEFGLGGYILNPEGLPVSSGTVTLRTGGAASSASISQYGRFRIVPHVAGLHDLYVSVPGLMVHHVQVTVPPSKTLLLPPFRLPPASFLHVRFLSPEGEPVVAPWVHRQGFDVGGMRVWEPTGLQERAEEGPDGTTIIGPLPRGVTTLVVEAALFARTRLPDVRVTGEEPVLDGGTVTLEPGASLTVEVVDAAGDPVPHHLVHLEEAKGFSPLAVQPERTDAKGRVTFPRLASGRYRLRTRSQRLCGSHPIAIVRSVDVPGAGSAHARLVIDGTVTLKLTSGGLPLIGRTVSLAPESATPPMPPWYRGRVGAPPHFSPSFGFFGVSGCVGATDYSGLATLTPMPPGPAVLTVRLPNATWVRSFTVPARSREIPIDVPVGFMAVRVLRDDTGGPLGGAALTWTSAGVRVQASTSVTGDALLDGVAARGGSLTIEAPGYRPLQERFATPPDVLHEARVQPTRQEGVRGHVITQKGEPITGAVVELRPEDPIEIGSVATTDAEGRVRFYDPPAGAARMIARADGYGVGTLSVSLHARDELEITLSRAYRILATLQSALGEGAHVFRVLSENGDAVDLLDARSERALHGTGEVSLGPVLPGTYLVEVRNGQERRQQSVLVRDRDVRVVVR
jgi:hypothetical protein